MKILSQKKGKKDEKITAEMFDAKFEKGEDLTPYLDFKKASVIWRVNVDFPAWMVKQLDKEAHRLNISRQAVVKTLLAERLRPSGGRQMVRAKESL